MPDTPNPTPESPPEAEGGNPQVRFETEDVNATGIFRIGIGLAVGIVLTAIGSWFLMGYYSAREEAEKRPVNFWAVQDRGKWQPHERHGPPGAASANGLAPAAMPRAGVDLHHLGPYLPVGRLHRPAALAAFRMKKSGWKRR